MKILLWTLLLLAACAPSRPRPQAVLIAAGDIGTRGSAGIQATGKTLHDL